MAVFIPDVKPEDFNNSPGEKEVYEALKLLGKDYTVFYSLSWISIGNDRTIGEADFILFHKENWKYKNVIVDEGQDLDDRLLNRLYDLSKSKKGSFYVFYDKNQFIMKKRQPHWLEDAECRLVLSKNCRNTAEIFKTACSIIGKENLTLNEIHGEVPFLRFYSTEKEMTAIVEGFLERMKKGEVPADKITILSASTLDNSFIDAKRKYAGFELSEKREPGKVHFTTIRKFKGLEAEAV